MNRHVSARCETATDSRLLAQGESHLERGQYADAAKAAQKVLRNDPAHLGGLELLAKAQWRSGDYEGGLDTLRHLIRLNPYEPGYHYLRGMALQSLGLYGEAIRSLSRCVGSEPASLAASAAASIRDLEAWQEGLIAELIKSDLRFRAEYALDPLRACHDRGFAFAAEDIAVPSHIAASNPTAAVVWDRPS